MMTIRTLLVTLVLLLGQQEVNAAFDIGPCIDQIMNNRNSGTTMCSTMTNYFKCIIKLTDIYKSSEIDTDMLSTIKSAFERGMRQAGVSCDIDVVSIVNQLREEYQGGLSPITQKPNGQQDVNALDIGPCIDQLMNSIDGRTTVCSAMTNYLKCIIKVTDIYKSSEIDNDMINELKSALESGMRQAGASCDIDVVSIVKQLREEYQAGLTPTTQKPNEYNGARTAVDCINTFTSVSQLGNMSCSQITPYAKCLFRVEKVYNMKNINYDQLEQNFNNTLSQFGIKCDIDARQLVEELRQETKDGKDSAFIARPFQLIALLAFTVLSMYLSYY